MVRRFGAVAAGVFACQMAMLVCLALAVGLMFALAEWPLLVLAGAAVLLIVPGLVGGGLAGIVARKDAVMLGALVGFLFGLSVVVVKLFVAPGMGYATMPYDIAVYPALWIGLTVTGAIGGLLARRWRPASARRPGRVVEVMGAGTAP